MIWLLFILGGISLFGIATFVGGSDFLQPKEFTEDSFEMDNDEYDAEAMDGGAYVYADEHMKSQPYLDDEEMERMHEETALRDHLEQQRLFQEEQDRQFHDQQQQFGDEFAMNTMDHHHHDYDPDWNNQYTNVGTDVNVDMDYHGVVDDPLDMVEDSYGMMDDSFDMSHDTFDDNW